MLVLILSLLVTVKVQRAFPGGSSVKNPPAVQETRVRSLGWEDPLEKGMATHSSIPAWTIPLAEEPGGLQSIGLLRVNTTVYALAYTAKIKPDNKSQIFPRLFINRFP